MLRLSSLLVSTFSITLFSSVIPFFCVSPHSPKELMESLCLFRQCQHCARTPSLHVFPALFLCPSLSLSLLLSREVNIFCRKADGELVLTTSRSASQSLPSSRHPHRMWPLLVLQRDRIGVAVLYLSVLLQ